MNAVIEWCVWLFVFGVTLRFLLGLIRFEAGHTLRRAAPKKLVRCEDSDEPFVAPNWSLFHFLAGAVISLFALVWLPLSLGFWLGNAVARLARRVGREQPVERPVAMNPSFLQDSFR